MPTPDASQFTQLKKYSAIATRKFDDSQYQQKRITHLYQPVPSVTEPGKFLPSFDKPNTMKSFTQINRVTGAESKPRVPGGNIRGFTPGLLPIIKTWTFTPVHDATSLTFPTLPGDGPFGRVVLRFDQMSPNVYPVITITFDTSSQLGYSISGDATYVSGSFVTSVSFGQNTIVMNTSISATTSDVVVATVDFASKAFNFPITNITLT
jgi:hypothetical protein